jgi:hypothetical protein
MDTKSAVEAYLAIRNKREELKQDYELRDLALKTEQDAIKVALLSLCNEANVSSMRTEAGTIIRQLKERAYCQDWGSFKEFVKEHDALDLFEHRIHQGNFKEFMAQHPDSGLPPGVNVMREFDISVRKSS